MESAGKKNKRKMKNNESLALSSTSQLEFERSVKRAKKTMAASDDSGVQKPDICSSNVIYLGHIPHGFYETEMRMYFGQFGKVLNVQLARSKVTGGSKGYAFIRFQSNDVARIVAETMNNYLMFERILKCNVVPPDQINDKWFRKDSQKLIPMLKSRAARQPPVMTDLKNGTQERKNRRLFRKIHRIARVLNDWSISFDVNLLIPASIQKSFEDDGVVEVDESDLSGDKLVIDVSDEEITFKVPPNTRTLLKGKKRRNRSRRRPKGPRCLVSFHLAFAP